jgi:hypothetical protein
MSVRRRPSQPRQAGQLVACRIGISLESGRTKSDQTQKGSMLRVARKVQPLVTVKRLEGSKNTTTQKQDSEVETSFDDVACNPIFDSIN